MEGLKKKKYIQCCYCKSNNRKYPFLWFNKPELMNEEANSYSSYGCEFCFNYNKDGNNNTSQV